MSFALRHLPDADATRRAGQALAQALRVLPLKQPFVVTLTGELGAGKTTLVSGFMQALGVAGPVRSPTYALLETYELADLTVLHLDLYRLTDPRQLEDLGLRDLSLPRTIFLVEWPDRGGDFFQHPDMHVHLEYANDEINDGINPGRELTIQSPHESLEGLVHSLPFSFT